MNHPTEAFAFVEPTTPETRWEVEHEIDLAWSAHLDAKRAEQASIDAECDYLDQLEAADQQREREEVAA